MINDEKRKFAIEELNKWGKHIDNFFWQISSLLIGGTAYAFVKVGKKVLGKEKDIWIIIISIIVIVLWYLYLLFMKYISLKQLEYATKINKLEKKLFKNNQKIDILPNTIKNDYTDDVKEEKEKEIYTRWFKWVMKHLAYCKFNYFDFMLVITISVWILWVCIIIKYLCIK